MDAFADVGGGDIARADDVREAEHECDEVRRDLVDAVSEAFTTPLEPEDLFQLSRDLDKVINGAKNTVRESEAMEFPPDQATAEMAVLLAEGVRASADGVQRPGRAAQRTRHRRPPRPPTPR